MLARVPGGRVDPGKPSTRYSQKELAQIWRVHRVTVRKWLVEMRRQGRGPTPAQAKVRLINGKHRDLMIRADYAVLLEMVFIERVK